jgi:hypothetical protein
MTDIQHTEVNMKYGDRFLIMFFMLYILFGLTHGVYGQITIADHSMNSYKMPPDVRAYFKNKYGNQLDSVNYVPRETPQGPSGYLQIKGHIVPKNRNCISGEGDSRRISIAQAFIQEEAGLFGIQDMTEWRRSGPSPISNGSRTTLINYKRYIHDVQLLSNYD